MCVRECVYVCVKEKRVCECMCVCERERGCVLC